MPYVSKELKTAIKGGAALHLYSGGAFVGSINRQNRLADGYRPEEPWLLLHLSGRVDRFATQAEAKDEARKHWGTVEFRRS
jgi:hypothetical protein